MLAYSTKSTCRVREDEATRTNPLEFISVLVEHPHFLCDRSHELLFVLVRGGSFRRLIGTAIRRSDIRRLRLVGGLDVRQMAIDFPLRERTFSVSCWLSVSFSVSVPFSLMIIVSDDSDESSIIVLQLLD